MGKMGKMGKKFSANSTNFSIFWFFFFQILAIFFLEFLHLRNRETSIKNKISNFIFCRHIAEIGPEKYVATNRKKKEKRKLLLLPTNDDQPATAGLLEVREPADTVTGPFCPTAVDKMAKSAREKRPRARRARGLRTCLFWRGSLFRSFGNNIAIFPFPLLSLCIAPEIVVFRSGIRRIVQCFSFFCWLAWGFVGEKEEEE